MGIMQDSDEVWCREDQLVNRMNFFAENGDVFIVKNYGNVNGCLYLLCLCHCRCRDRNEKDGHQWEIFVWEVIRVSALDSVFSFM